MISFRLILRHPKLWGYIFLSFGILAGLWLLRPYFSKQITDSDHLLRNFATIEIGLPDENQLTPVAFADFDNSRYVDILYTNSKKDKLELFQYDEGNNIYSNKYQIELPNTKLINAFPFDFQQTGFNDLILTTSKNGEKPYSISLLENEKGQLSSSISSEFDIKSDKIPLPMNSFDSEYTPEIYFVKEGAQYTSKYVKNGSLIVDTSIPAYDSIAAAQFIDNMNIQLLVKVKENDKTYLKLYTQNETLLSTSEIPNGAGDLHIADINHNNGLDVLFPVFPSNNAEDPYLCILFNTHNEKQVFVNKSECKNSDLSMRVPITGLTSECLISIGDLDLNSRPDIVVSCNDKKTRILLNQQCRGCGTGETVFAEHSPIEGKGVIFDLFSDGFLDIITEGAAYQGNLTANEMFVFVSPLNGVCLEHCKNGVRYPIPQPLSTVVTGGTTRVVYTDKSGQRHRAVGVTRATNHLELPYNVFGLGNQLHYIEEVKVITTSKSTWAWVLPNSLVYASKGNSARIIIGYKVHSFPVLFACTSLLILLGFFIFYYSTEEEDEDKKEAEKMLPLF